MFYYRRKIILALLELFGRKLSATQLQKYLFLFTRKQQGQCAFDFVPYKYGCFSFQANQDVYTLSKYGYLTITDDETREISLAHPTNYMFELDMFDQQAMRDIYEQFGCLSQNELIRYTYIRYPFYAINSTIAERILTPDELQRVVEQRRKFSDIQLFTIGYEGRSL